MNRRGAALQIAALLLFVTAGILVAPLLGFEDDEVIFVNLFLHPNDSFSRLPLFGGHAIPAMAASYAGALKTWLYSPLFLFAAPTVWLVRLPAVLLAALTIVLAGRLMTLIAGQIAGVITVCLLATDVTFLLTATFDWGPVVIQHLLLVTTLLLLIEWYRKPNSRLLFLSGLAIGLALWDKSLFLWQLSGWTVALLLIAYPVLQRVWSRNNICTFTRGALLGAFPLIAANFRHHFATIKDNGHMSLAEVGIKAAFMRSALDGQAATSFLIDSGSNGMDRIQRPLATLALALTRSLGNAPSLWRFYPGLVVILLGIYLASSTQRKWTLFFLASGCVAWFQSAITLHAGNVIHHAVLFWISWYCAFSLSLTVLLRSPFRYLRLATALVVILLCLRGVLVIGAGYGELIAHPGTARWTNADSPLSDRLLSSGVKRIIVADWGIKNVIGARSDDRIAVDNQGVALNLGVFNQNAFNSCLTKDCVVVAHAPGRNVFSAAPAILDRALLETGFSKAGKTVVYDTHGIPAFEFYYLKNVKPHDNNYASKDTSDKPTISAYSATIISPGGARQVQLIWRVGMGVDAQIHRNAPNGPLSAAGTGPGSFLAGSVRDGTEFFLQDVTGGKPLTSANTLARVTVHFVHHF